MAGASVKLEMVTDAGNKGVGRYPTGRTPQGQPWGRRAFPDPGWGL